jgi:tetratricopeptide (TPR) repeat protein
MALGVANFRSADGGRFLARAVTLGPARAQAHFWLARWFAAADMRPQAWAEYRAAIALSPTYVQLSLHDMLQFGASLAELEVVAHDERLLEVVSFELIRAKRLDDAAHVDALIIARFPPAVPARSRTIERLIQSGEKEKARDETRALIAAAPTAPQGYLFDARLEHDPKAAVAILERGLAVVGDNAELLMALIRMRSEQEPMSALSSELDRLNRVVVARDGSAVSYHAFLAECALARKQPTAALRHFLDAAAASPDGLAHLETAAQLADSLALHHIAASSWRKLSFAKPDDARYRAALEKAEAAAKAVPIHGPVFAAP